MVKKNLKRIIIAAVSQNGIIGNGNKIPWYSKDEFDHFKNTTFGSPIILGRKTFDSIGKELKGRLNIIISKLLVENHSSKNILQFQSISDAYKHLRKNNYKKVYICGGGRVYSNVIKHADEMIISHMNFDSEGDINFPKINRTLWRIKKETEYKEFIVKHYLRRNMSH